MKSTQLYRQVPWTGGLNDTVDPGLIPASDLVTAENILLTTSGARIKRQGHSHMDRLSLVPATTFRESTGTTRTLTFETDLSDAVNDYLVVGESIRVTLGPSTYNGDFIITAISTNTITYTATGSLTESSIADTAIVITRLDRIMGLHDLWYFNPATSNKEQQIIAVTLSALEVNPVIKLFRYTLSGNRKHIASQPIDTFLNADVTLADDTITLTGHNLGTAAIIRLSTTDTLPTGLAASTDYFVIVVDANTISLATSSLNAVLGTKINITDVTGSGTHTLTIKDQDAWGSTTINSVQMLTVNNRVVFAFDAVGVRPRVYKPLEGVFTLLAGDAPDFSTMSYHFQRLVTNDKINKDRVHYSPPGQIELWQGFGDSGAINVGSGDGDPAGVVCIFPSFKGRVFISKRQRTYQLVGDSPENYQVLEISAGLGAIAPQSVAQVDLDDVVYWSDKGIHSLAATDSFGDFTGAFISSKIQNRFNSYPQGRLKFTQGVYVGQLNSIVWLVTDLNRTDFSSLLFFNTVLKEWFTWPAISASCLTLITKDSKGKLYYAKDGRIVETQDGTFTDFIDQPIRFLIKTGAIYPLNNVDAISGFKKFTLLYKPRGSFEATVGIKIDNFSPQFLQFNQTATGALLGTDFILGQSVLAFENVFAPFTQSIDGFGRGASIEVEQSGIGEQLEIYGFGFEVESAETEQETKQTGVND